MHIPQSFFYKALKPGRYIGADVIGHPEPMPGERRVVWFFPGRYEDAVVDPDYRRGFFTLRSALDAHVARAIDFARDAWELLAQRKLPPFTIDGHGSIADADVVVFWVPDVFAAARIPSLLARLDLDRSRTQVGVVVNGCWAPRFLKSSVDWICPAPYGRLPGSVADVIQGRVAPGSSEVCFDPRSDWTSVAEWDAGSIPLLQTDGAATEQWLPLVETGHLEGHLDLWTVGADGRLAARAVSDCVADALNTLRTTGVEGLRVLDSGIDSGMRIPTILIELTRVFNMARTQIELPAFPVEEFDQRWRAYKPHLIKPVLRLRIGTDNDPQAVVDAGRNALNDGWHGLTLVPAFDTFAEFSELIPSIETIVAGWSRAASGFEDRRPIRVQYEPAPIERWSGSPEEPSEDDLRRLLYECRHLAESVSGTVSVGQPRIEAVIARNWLAATTDDIWDTLASLDLSDPNDESMPAFDWLGWIRNRSGMLAPPTTAFARGSLPLQTVRDLTELPSSGQVQQQSQIAESELQFYGRRKRRAPVSRRLQAPSRNRLRVCWSKSVAWRFFSHLDMVRVIERAIRAAGLPVSYSEGFHPRMKISFGPPLSFGLVSRAELFDVVLERNVEDSDIDALRRALPEGVDIVEGQGLPAQVPSLTETINEAEYSALIPMEAETAQSLIEAFMQQPRIQFRRPDRPDRKPFDPRVSLRQTEMEIVPDGVRWTIRLSIGTQGQIRPAEWAALIFGFTEDQIGELIIERTALRVRRNNTVSSPFDTVGV